MRKSYFVPEPSTLRSAGSLALATALFAATAILVWLAFHATLESRRSVRLLLERRNAEQLALLLAGIAQDMKGAHATVLVPVTPNQLVPDPPYDLADSFARGFSRFPYPEAFFAWKESGTEDGLTYLFNRANRPAMWNKAAKGDPSRGNPDELVGPYPVQVVRDPPAMRTLVARARREAQSGPPFAVFETRMDGVPYQVVVNFLYRSDRNALFGLVGFTVNLDWVRRAYFNELTLQISRIGGAPTEVSLAVLDDTGKVFTETRPVDATIPAASRAFPVVFIDRSLLPALRLHSAPTRYWTARVGPAKGSRLAAAAFGGRGTLLVSSLAAAATVIGLLLTARGVRIAGELATMKFDFVSSVTHELKTPLALIQLIADALVRGHYDSPETIREYATLLSREGQHLAALIDNLLAYARLSDAKHAYRFEPVDIGDLVDDVLDRFRSLLIERQFSVALDVHPDLPEVRADRPALFQALDNLIDNAIKYSDGTRKLQIRAHTADQFVTISVADRGVGIHADEVERVCDKFFRGRNVRTGGSGLGLAISRQIILAHGGRLRIESVPGQGTRVDVMVPQVGAS